MSSQVSPALSNSKATLVDFLDPANPSLVAHPSARHDVSIITKGDFPVDILDDVIAQKRLVRKMDIRVILPLAIIFFWAFIDRVNLGYLRLQGLEKDLGMHGSDFNKALLAQVAPYILFEIPSNLVLKRVRPSLWLGGLSLCWGFITLGQGLVRSFHGLVVLRVFLGTFEAGLVPGTVYLVSMYYKRFELQKRMVGLYIANCIAIATGGLIAYAITDLDGYRGYRSWRWVFIIEGTITIGLSIILLFIVADWPEQAKWLSPHEKTLLAARQAAEDGGLAHMDRLDRKALRRILTDWKIYSAIVIYFGVAACNNATAFVPSIIARLGYKAAAAQAYTIPIYVVAGALAFVAAVAADRLRNRFAFCIFGVCLSITGLTILMNSKSVSVHAQYGALYLFNGGCFMVLPTLWTWLSNNMGGHYKRAWSSAAQIGLGNAGAIVPTMTFVTNEAPEYTRAYSICLSLICLTGLVMCATEAGLWYENRLRRAGKRNYRLQLPDEEQRNLGDDHPSFRFTY